MYCRRRCQPIVHPVMCCTKHVTEIIEVPHIHPIQNITVQHQIYQHKHYFPESHKSEHTTAHQKFYCK
ncbi:CotD family spore coat protein [Jeotgalibacillus marinus]|uniref:CotD family spore coat protein n=1 Tax=Jeotgalibacillus marinus TaxID=86667 RepID=A0ABV3Q3E4_9BACL